MSFVETIVKPLIDDAYYKGVAYGAAQERLKKDMEYEQEMYRMFNRGVEHGREQERLDLGVIEEISAEEFDRLTGPKTEIPEGFGFVGTIDDLSLVLDEEAV